MRAGYYISIAKTYIFVTRDCHEEGHILEDYIDDCSLIVTEEDVH